MATGNTIMPYDDEVLANEKMTSWLSQECVYLHDHQLEGRWPTLRELREALDRFGFAVEESGSDLYVSSEKDYTSLWLNGNYTQLDEPVKFSSRRGDPIVLTIGQELSRICGPILTFNHSSVIPVLHVPPSLVPDYTVDKEPASYFEIMVQRIPFFIAALENETNIQQLLFYLSQIRQPLRRGDYLKQREVYQLVQEGLDRFAELLYHEDERVRFLAFDLIARIRYFITSWLPNLRDAIQREPDPTIKARMIDSVAERIAPLRDGGNMGQPDEIITPILEALIGADSEDPTVRFTAFRVLSRAIPGKLTPQMRELVIAGLTNPDRFALDWNPSMTIFSQALDTLKRLMLNQRIAILREALPDIDYVEDAYNALTHLLDYAFFGAVKPIGSSSLLPDAPVERLEVDEDKFR